MNKESKNVCAVIATYNRKKPLSKCLSYLKFCDSLDAIYLIDNASNDGTPNLIRDEGYIKELPPVNSNEIWKTSSNVKNQNGKTIKFYYRRNFVNGGSAGGFYDGIRGAYKEGYKWIWVLDNDSIPKKNSLDKLLEKTELAENIGFLCSKALWCDGTVHIMNIPQIQPLVKDIPFNKFENSNVSVIRACSWLSLLIKREVIEEVGLPLKEFFVWAEDVEYTNRMTENNYLGLYVADSIVYHETKKNYSDDIIAADVENIMKYSFGIRNNLYLMKQRSILLFILLLGYNLIFVNFNILKNRKDNKLKFFWTNTVSSLKSIFFRPGND
jgi:rhamnopyranosyl-N-acetylglucosaminyl-diphospho-decaprenol beta-1,3/1,4-galactofuranosyltransferase